MVDLKSRLENIPGYEPGKPAHRMDDVTFMDELEAMWGRKWGAQSGLGELRVVLLNRPGEEGLTGEEEADPQFFLRFGASGDLPDWTKRIKQHEELRAALQSEGVETIYTDHDPDELKGPYTSRVRGVGLEPVVIRGGAIVHRSGVAWKRGSEPLISKFLAKIGCPILMTVHGKAVHETRGNTVFLDPKTCIEATNVSTNMAGIHQVDSVLRRAGVEEIHVTNLPSYLDSMRRSGAAMGFHLANVLNMAAEKLAVVHSGALPYGTLRFLQSKGIKLIDTPEEEAVNQAANICTIRPGVVIMAAGNPVTTAALRKEGVRVIEVDLSESARFGSGPICQTGPLVRDDGPYLDD